MHVRGVTDESGKQILATGSYGVITVNCSRSNGAVTVHSDGARAVTVTTRRRGIMPLRAHDIDLIVDGRPTQILRYRRTHVGFGRTHVSVYVDDDLLTLHAWSSISNTLQPFVGVHGRPAAPTISRRGNKIVLDIPKHAATAMSPTHLAVAIALAEACGTRSINLADIPWAAFRVVAAAWSY